MPPTLLLVGADRLPAMLRDPRANLWPTMEVPTVDTFKLATLRFILQGGRWDTPDALQYEESFKGLDGDGDFVEPSLHIVPADLVRMLAGLRNEQLWEVAQAWAGTADAKRSGWVAEDVESFLGDLHHFAVRAIDEDWLMVLWVGD